MSPFLTQKLVTTLSLLCFCFQFFGFISSLSIKFYRFSRCSPAQGNTVIKSKLIGRRMFLITAAKAVVMVGLVGRLISLQINQSTKYKSLSDKNRFRE